MLRILVILGIVFSLVGCGSDSSGPSGTSDAGESDIADGTSDVVDDTAEDPAPDPAEDSAEDPQPDPVEDAVEDVVEDPIEDAVEDTTDEPVEDAGDDTADDPVDDTPQDTTDTGEDTTDASDADDTSDTDDASMDADDVGTDTEDVSMDAEDVAMDTDDTGTDVADDSSMDSDDGGMLPPFPSACALLTNGNAETGDLMGWTVEEGEFEAVGEQFFSTPAPYQGDYQFAAGSVATSILSQDVDVSESAAHIDAGGIWAHFDAQVRDWNGDDGASLILSALDAGGAELNSVQVGPYFSDEWTERMASLELPVGTRTVRSSLRGDRSNGSANDAYFDVADLCVTDMGPTAMVGELLSPPYLMWATTDAVSVRFESDMASVATVDYGTTAALGMTQNEDMARTSHEIRLTGLEPDTLYYYAISWAGGPPLPTRTFRTAQLPEDDDPFMFVVWGDNQNGPDNFTRLTPVMAMEDPAFGVSTGDCVQNGTRAEYREQLFWPMDGFADEVPFVVGAGNHERYGGDSGAALFDEYMSQGGDEHCFGYQWGPLYLVLIDTELSISAGSDQHACITAAFSTPEAQAATFRAAAFHKPPRIEFWFGGVLAFPESMEAPWVREELEPLLESLDVDIVFNGHNHLYAHSPETAGGITWVTTGGAGGMLDSLSAIWRVRTWPEIDTQISEHHFLRVYVDGDTMTVRAIGMDGGVIHEFTVTADP